MNVQATERSIPEYPLNVNVNAGVYPAQRLDTVTSQIGIIINCIGN